MAGLAFDLKAEGVNDDGPPTENDRWGRVWSADTAR